ncbi:hypothetical protein GQ55_3G454900 [Panicum hallii var. hallii]|uniref:Dof zinc finger protein n=1 Tax=Panicum hallii var. hallii TaxID=1504633 RepID=A0A2T7EIN5_9POAL|nr:hypothetical protein GQ55_3G454900 [Panicum hallii var. hallii]
MEAPLHRSPAPLPPPPDALLLRQPAAAAGRERCPRCASRDTKFCYYNNYNTAQPRHFCRACRRYWTLGGSLRNVPVGGSARKRPRPARPTRAITAAVAAATTTAPAPSGPFAAASHVAAASAPALQGGGLLGSLLLLGSASPPLALGAAPLLEGRLGSDDLGLGQPALLAAGAGDLAQLAFGAGPLPWPVATTVLEGERAEAAWKSCGAFPLPPAAALWQELAAAAPPAEAGGLHLHHGGSPHLLL